MATEAFESQPLLVGATEPKRGLVDRTLFFIDRAPGPAAVAYIAIAIVLAVVGHLVVWAAGAAALGTFTIEVVIAPFVFAWSLWLIHTLNRVASESFDEFRPALGDPTSEDRYLLELTSIRDSRAFIAGIATSLFMIGIYFGFVRPLVGLVSGRIEDVVGPFWFLAAFALGVLVLHTVNQLRLVGRLSAVARNVDIFNPGPINAFSRLTAASAMGLIALVVVLVLYSPDQPIVYVVQEIGLLALAVASFVLPLRVMHHRLDVEKKHLSRDSRERLKSMLARVHREVDGDDLAASEKINHALNSLITERDFVDRLRTWPWSTSTIRGFVSALLLPIALIVVGQVVAKLI
jgi:hypothetical protein